MKNDDYDDDNVLLLFCVHRAQAFDARTKQRKNMQRFQKVLFFHATDKKVIEYSCLGDQRLNWSNTMGKHSAKHDSDKAHAKQIFSHV